VAQRLHIERKKIHSSREHKCYNITTIWGVIINNVSLSNVKLCIAVHFVHIILKKKEEEEEEKKNIL
jgi:hypothetical protein